MEAVARVFAGRVVFSQIPAFTLVALLAAPGAISASWLATGPFGGDADIVRTIPHLKGEVVAATHNGLIFTSHNGAASWKNLPFPAQFSGVLHALEIDPNSADTWYAGVESEIGRISGVYKTTDRGTTWKQLPGTVGIGVWSLALFPGDTSVIAAGTSTGVFISQDAGATWKHITQDSDTEIRPVGLTRVSSHEKRNSLCGHNASAVAHDGRRRFLAIDPHRNDRRFRRFQYSGGCEEPVARDGERLQRRL